ncbi:hypothetical protein B0H17DRAFT_1148398 [Mycena rosella]|uniref:Uncharacterized protein n=1 Tax=Mycena rosella TaxID=1033263 RepID=A0AAD7CDA5_MYCRO|nr:hypothetical protein B0H17DRAFT_1148398 [Mycena rosella]
MFEEAADFTSGEIKAYRKFVFPDALAAPDHDPFFSVENAPSWITALGFQVYLMYDDDSGDSNSLWTSDIASTIQLKAYRSYSRESGERDQSPPIGSIHVDDLWVIRGLSWSAPGFYPLQFSCSVSSSILTSWISS